MPAISFPIGSGERHRRWPAPLALPLAFGTERYPPKIRRRLQTLNAMAYLIVITSTIYALIYALEDFETYFWIVVVNLVLAAVGVCVPLSHRFHELAGGGLILVCEPIALFALVAVLGRDTGDSVEPDRRRGRAVRNPRAGAADAGRIRGRAVLRAAPGGLVSVPARTRLG